MIHSELKRFVKRLVDCFEGDFKDKIDGKLLDEYAKRLSVEVPFR